MKRNFLSAAGACLFFVFVGTAQSDEIAELKRQLAEQTKILQQMQKRLERIEAQQAQQDKQMEEQITKAVEEKQIEALPENAKWIENLKWSGDFRYRHETIEAEGDGKSDRHRNRIRARLRLDAVLNEEWDAVFRLATAEADSDPSDGLAKGSTSTNQTLTREFKQKNIWLDWAYAKYHPSSVPGLNVQMGKMGTPVYKAGKNQVIWDSDLAWEGGAVNYSAPLENGQELLLNGGGFWLREVDGADTHADASLWTTQAALKQNIDDSYLLGGASYYHFANSDAANITSTSRGNSSDFDGDFNLVEAFAEVGTNIYEDMPVAFYGSYVKNIGTDSDKDTAWIIGTKLNKAKKLGSWEVFYNYRDLQADSVSPILNDSDFAGGGTAARGHGIGLKYQIHKNVQAGVTYLFAERDRTSDDVDYKVLMGDLILKF
jgi:hypothetical protein